MIDPDVDPRLEDHVRRTLHAVAYTTPDHIDELGAASDGLRRWRPVSIAAAAMLVVGVAATYALTLDRSDDPGEAASSATVTAPAEISMVPPALPDGYSLSVAMHSVLEPDPIQRRVYARASDPTDASSWINVWFAVNSPGDSPLEVTCTDQPDNEPFTIGDLAAATCRLGGGPWRSAVWETGGLVVDVTASSAVSREELVAFSQGLTTESIEEPRPGLPPVNLVSDDPQWVALAGTDLTRGTTIRQTLLVATDPEAPEQGSVQVWAWNGSPDEGRYIITRPLDAELVTINEREALLQLDAEGNPLSVAWTQTDGLVVMVSAPLDREGLLAFAASLTPIDEAAFEAYAAAAGITVTAPTP